MRTDNRNGQTKQEEKINNCQQNERMGKTNPTKAGYEIGSPER